MDEFTGKKYKIVKENGEYNSGEYVQGIVSQNKNLEYVTKNKDNA